MSEPEVTPTQKSELEKTLPEITKSLEIFEGDINVAVITVQEQTGFEITPEWWAAKVGNHGSTEDILSRFDEAFEEFVHEKSGIKTVGDKISTVEEAADKDFLEEFQAEKDEFEKQYAEDPAYHYLQQEFIDALIKHLHEKYYPGELDQMDQGEIKILVAGSPDYNEAEAKRHLDEDPSTKIVERHYKSKDGTEIAVLGTSHTYSADDPEIQYLDKLVRSLPKSEGYALILEGQYGDANELPADPQEALRVAGGEFAYMAALAKQEGIDVISAEPDPRESARKILAERPDIKHDDIALHYALKSLVGIFREGSSAPLESVAPYIYHSVGIAGDIDEGGWVQRSTSRDEVLALTDEQKSEIALEMPSIIEKLNEQFEKIKPGETLLELGPDGNLTLMYDLNSGTIPWDPSPELSDGETTVITEISRMDMLMRDRHTFELIQQALERGQKPIVAVGSSHISTLKPALDSTFETQVA